MPLGPVSMQHRRTMSCWLDPRVATADEIMNIRRPRQLRITCDKDAIIPLKTSVYWYYIGRQLQRQNNQRGISPHGTDKLTNAWLLKCQRSTPCGRALGGPIMKYCTRP